MQFIQDITEEIKTIYIFQLAYAKSPGFDGFVSYNAQKRRLNQVAKPKIHGFQCKLTRGYPRHEANPDIEKGWFLRGGTAINTPDEGGWTYPTMEYIETNLLGYGLRLLHPVEWGHVPNNDLFDS